MPTAETCDSGPGAARSGSRRRLAEPDPCVPSGEGDRILLMSTRHPLAQALEWYMGFKRAIGEPLMLGKEEKVKIHKLSESMTVPYALTNDIFKRGACPDCGGTVEHADGCVVCRGCGYTECG